MRDKSSGKWIAMIHEILEKKGISTAGELVWRATHDTPAESSPAEELIWKIFCNTPGEAEFESKHAMKRLEAKV